MKCSKHRNCSLRRPFPEGVKVCRGKENQISLFTTDTSYNNNLETEHSKSGMGWGRGGECFAYTTFSHSRAHMYLVCRNVFKIKILGFSFELIPVH